MSSEYDDEVREHIKDIKRLNLSKVLIIFGLIGIAKYVSFQDAIVFGIAMLFYALIEINIELKRMNLPKR